MPGRACIAAAIVNQWKPSELAVVCLGIISWHLMRVGEYCIHHSFVLSYYYYPAYMLSLSEGVRWISMPPLKKRLKRC